MALFFRLVFPLLFLPPPPPVVVHDALVVVPLWLIFADALELWLCIHFSLIQDSDLVNFQKLLLCAAAVAT